MCPPNRSDSCFWLVCFWVCVCVCVVWLPFSPHILHHLTVDSAQFFLSLLYQWSMNEHQLFLHGLSEENLTKGNPTRGLFWLKAIINLGFQKPASVKLLSQSRIDSPPQGSKTITERKWIMSGTQGPWVHWPLPAPCTPQGSCCYAVDWEASTINPQAWWSSGRELELCSKCLFSTPA